MSQGGKLPQANLFKSPCLGSPVIVNWFIFLLPLIHGKLLILVDTECNNLIFIFLSSYCCIQGALLHFILTDTHTSYSFCYSKNQQPYLLDCPWAWCLQIFLLAEVFDKTCTESRFRWKDDKNTSGISFISFHLRWLISFLLSANLSLNFWLHELSKSGLVGI